jgi:hypothetical protein
LAAADRRPRREGDAAARFLGRAEAEISAALIELLGGSDEISAAGGALNVTFDATLNPRSAAGIGDAPTPFLTAAWLRRVAARLAVIAGEEADAAARTAQQLTAELGYACLQFERAEWQRRLESTEPAKAIEDAPTYASMLASEIDRYHEAGIAALPDGNISAQIRSAIDRARRDGPGRVPSEGSAPHSALHDLLLELMGADDAKTAPRP